MQTGHYITAIPPILSVIVSLFMAFAAIYKKAYRSDHYLFSLVCLWHAVMPAAYLAEYLIADAFFLISLKKAAYIIYAFYPLILLLFFRKIFKRKQMTAAASCIVLSLFFAFYIPSGLKQTAGQAINLGPASRLTLFSLYGAAVLIYIVICFYQSIKNETNPVSLMKKKYMLFSLSAAGILMLLNIPAVKHMDLYPLGNYSFIPMMVLGYGVLKYRLMDLQIAFNLTGIISLILISIVALNYIILKSSWPYLGVLGFQASFFFCIVSFLANLSLVLFSKAVVYRLFYRSVQLLEKAEADLIMKIKYLKNINVLFYDIATVMKNNLKFESTVFYLRSSENADVFEGQNFVKHQIELPITKWLAKKKIVERSIVETHPEFVHFKMILIDLFDRLDCYYIAPLILENELTGLLCFSERPSGRPLSSDESRFVQNIAQAAAIAIFNATIYKHSSDMKDRLEKQTVELRFEVEQRKTREKQLKEIHKELEKSNKELEISVLQANEMTSKAERTNFVLEMEMKERQKAELALRRNEEKYRLIAENTSDVIWTMNLDLEHTFVSPSIYPLRGVTVEEAMDQKLSDFLTPASLEKATDALKHAIDSPGEGLKENPYRVMELELIHKDGSSIWTETTATLLRGEDGKPREVIGVTRNISERKKAERELVYVAFHDSLTGLHNRSAFISQFETDIALARRNKTKLAVLFMDLDRFKEVNDNFGHEIGDFVLKEAAIRLRKAVREVDYVARLGGDEFTVILRGLDDTHPEIVFDRITKSFSNPFFIRNLKIDFIQASIGISIFPDNGNDMEALLMYADDAMYKMKKGKKERISA